MLQFQETIMLVAWLVIRWTAVLLLIGGIYQLVRSHWLLTLPSVIRYLKSLGIVILAAFIAWGSAALAVLIFKDPEIVASPFWSQAAYWIAVYLTVQSALCILVCLLKIWFVVTDIYSE